MRNPARQLDKDNPKIYKQERRFKHWSLTIFAILFCLFVGLVLIHHQDSGTVNSGYARNVSLQNYETRSIKPVKRVKYIINAKGQMDYGAAKSLYQIESIMSSIYTYSNTSQFNANVNYAHKYINDPVFFKYFKNTDNSGNSVIKDLGIKSKYKSCQAYELRPGRYLVVVSYYLYHNPNDLTQLDKLHATQRGFVITGSNGQFSHVREVNGLSLQDD